MTWLLYGANGFTGRLIAEEAVRQGERPTLAGRSGDAVREVASELALPHRVFALDDPGSVARELRDVRAVVLAAGPFSRTSTPILQACLDSGAHYLDITGELEVLEAVLSRDADARGAGCVLLPGAGFDVVPTDCVALRLAETLRGATSLELAVHGSGGTSQGTLRTMAERVLRGGAVRRDGRLHAVPVAAWTKQVVFRDGRRLVTCTPWGDVVTAWHSTGISEITTYVSVPPVVLASMRAWWLGRGLAKQPPVQRLVEQWIRAAPAGPSADERRGTRCQIWGRAEDARGRAAEATATTPEGYGLTAVAAVECVRRVLQGVVAPGAWTPSRAFGSGFLEGLPGCDLRSRTIR